MMNQNELFYYETSTVLSAYPNYQYAREPVLRRMPNGSLIVTALSGGPKEPHEDNFVLITRSDDDGATWSEPEILFQHGERAVWVTEIFTKAPFPLMFVNT